jgi:hypothetical protein
MTEIVYVLTNPAMPGLIKIGRTAAEDANGRIAQLYTTGVPVPFKIEFACKVESADEVEDALHIAFAPHRINPRREFFEVDPGQAIAILRLLHTEDATNQVERQSAGLDNESIAAGEELQARRPRFNFEEMGIPIGSILRCIRNDSVVTVVGPKKIKLADDVLSLTAATRQVLGIDHNVQPGPYWTFNGRLLREIYNETYGDLD